MFQPPSAETLGVSHQVWINIKQMLANGIKFEIKNTFPSNIGAKQRKAWLLETKSKFFLVIQLDPWSVFPCSSSASSQKQAEMDFWLLFELPPEAVFVACEKAQYSSFLTLFSIALTTC